MKGEQGQEWFRYAREDLRSAEFLLGMHPQPIEIICYHCEQAAEKMLKGVLAANDVEPPKTHDLVELCKRCGEIDESYLNLAEQCISLTPYGVQARYPSNVELEEGDMKEALSECRIICEAVEQTIGFTDKPEQRMSMEQTM